jgi:RNA polymerase sigma factor (sigma-70 family)
MMDTREAFLDLMRRVREGDEEAARDLYDRYGPSILRVVRQRLHPPLRARFDSCDFLQSVWTSFFAQAVQKRNFDSPEALVAFLRKVALHKVIGAYRKEVQTARRDCSREQQLESPTEEQVEGRDHDLASPTPTPSQEAVAREHWEQLLRGQPDLVQHILRLRREGHTYEEIAQSLNVNTKRIQRLLRRLDPGRPHDRQASS